MADNMAILKPLEKMSLSFTDWRSASGLMAKNFGSAKARMITNGHVTKGLKQKDPYSLTEDGKKYLNDCRTKWAK